MNRRTHRGNFYLACVLLSVGLVAPILAAGAQQAPARPAAAPGKGGPVEEGRKLFETNCKACHGEAGVGSRAPALRSAKLTAPFVRGMVSRGKPGTLMPQFGGRLSPAQIEGLAQYVASLQQRPDDLVGLKGDSMAGRGLFFNRGAAHSCHVCHAFRGEGGKVGPDLAARLSARTPRDIFQRIIVVPHRSADPAYLKVAITTRSGQRYVGIRAEGSSDQEFEFYDTASLPPILRSLNRADVVSVQQLNGTAMPSDYASRLSLKQLLDLVAFLKSGGQDTPQTIMLSDVIDIAPARPRS